MSPSDVFKADDKRDVPKGHAFVREVPTGNAFHAVVPGIVLPGAKYKASGVRGVPKVQNKNAAEGRAGTSGTESGDKSFQAKKSYP
eukprot:5641273-Amphidinium_carterae.1